MRENRLNVLQDILRRIRDKGVLVGLSAHNPALIELAEERNWNVDYYMCCLYYLTRPRPELQKLLGKDLPLGEIYLPTDPPRMFKVIQSVKKPCLVYKVLAAGRLISTPAQVRQCFQTALTNIKPTDALIVGSVCVAAGWAADAELAAAAAVSAVVCCKKPRLVVGLIGHLLCRRRTS